MRPNISPCRASGATGGSDRSSANSSGPSSPLLAQSLESRGFYTWPGVFTAVTRHFAEKSAKPFSHIVIDEAQDLGVPSCASSRRLRRKARTPFSSPATWASASSSNPFPGRRSASTFAGAPLRSRSTIARRTKSAALPTSCCQGRSATLTAWSRSAKEQSRSSMGLSPKS